MNEERLAEIEARANAAHVGPWEVEWYNGKTYLLAGPLKTNLAGFTIMSQRDCEFCAQARQDVPDLVAEVRRLRQVLACKEHNIRLDWKMPDPPAEKCPECGGMPKAVAFNTGDGWGMMWECENECGEPFRDAGDIVDVWPFVVDFAGADDLEAAGFEVI